MSMEHGTFCQLCAGSRCVNLAMRIDRNLRRSSGIWLAPLREFYCVFPSRGVTLSVIHWRSFVRIEITIISALFLRKDTIFSEIAWEKSAYAKISKNNIQRLYRSNTYIWLYLIEQAFKRLIKWIKRAKLLDIRTLFWHHMGNKLSRQFGSLALE